MRNHAVIIGLLVLGVCHTAAAQGFPLSDTLYSRLQRITEQEEKIAVAEVYLEQFVPHVIGEERMVIEEGHIDLGLQNNFNDLCEGEDGVSLTACKEIAGKISQVVHNVAPLRTLGRDLQLIATSYERPVDGMTGRTDSLSQRFPSLIKIWQSSIDAVTNPHQGMRVRAAPLLPPAVMQPLYNTLKTELNSLIDSSPVPGSTKQGYERVNAAVRRYRHGLKSVAVADNGNPVPCVDQFGDGSDLELLFVRFCTVETALQAVADALPDSAAGFDPPIAPLGPDEILLFPPVSFPELNAVLWMRLDDVGLMPGVHLDPILPQLVSLEGDVVLGGEYPEPPEIPPDRRSICSHPFGNRGYLCRSIQDGASCPIECEDCGEPNTIELTSCSREFIRPAATTSLPVSNICSLGGWRLDVEDGNFAEEGGGTVPGPDTPDIDVDMKMDEECSTCFPDLVCRETCSHENGGLVKDIDTGRIEVCIEDDDDPLIPATYRIIHKLAHVQRLCPLIATSLDYADGNCCAHELEASEYMCSALGIDGNFDDSPLTVERCAAIYSNMLCGDGSIDANDNIDSPCTLEPSSADDVTALEEAFERNEAGVPKLCSDAVEELDARAEAMRHTLPRVCSPGCKVRYENTIGNNLCYIGQCIEQSTHLVHRVTPGHLPFGVQDQAFPWDACVAPDPQLGALVTLPPPVLPTRLQPYRGAEIVRELDRFLCQANGFPALTPPVLCKFDSRRRLNVPLQNPLMTMLSTRRQERVTLSTAKTMDQILSNAGPRLGTQLYQRYLSTSAQAFNELTTTIGSLITQIGNTNFATTMCPRYHPDSCDVLQ